jgi:hypothetical protein
MGQWSMMYCFWSACPPDKGSVSKQTMGTAGDVLNNYDSTTSSSRTVLFSRTSQVNKRCLGIYSPVL